MIKIQRPTKRLYVLLVAWLFSQFLFSEENDKPFTHPSFVDEVVVTGEAVEETATVTLVTATDIKEKGIKTVAEALRYIPGAQIQVGGKGEAYIRLRGFDQREIALLIDGVPVYSPYDGVMDLSSLPLDAVERIEVVKGPASMLYGSNAMGGVINIITKKSNGERHLAINGEYGSGETVKLGTIFKGKLRGVRYLFTGAYDNQEYYPLSNGYTAKRNQDEGHRSNSDRRTWNGQLSLGWDMGTSSRVSFNISHLDIVRGLPHHDSDSKAQYWRFNDWSKTSVDLLYQEDYKRASLKGKIYYNYLNNTLDSYDDAGYDTQDGKYAFTDTLWDYTLGGDIFFRYRLGSQWLLKLATRFHSDLHRKQTEGEDNLERNLVNMLSVPLEIEWSPLSRLTLTAGSSLDMMIFRKEGSTDQNSTSALSGQLAVLVEPTKRLKLKASVSHKTRFPTMKEMFSSTSGNPDLKPMKSDGFEVGADYMITSTLSLSVVGFYSDIKDLINRYNKNDPYINIDEASFKGIETSLQWNFNENSMLNLSYTHLISKDKTSPDQSAIQYRPKHKIDGELLIKLPVGLTSSLSCSYVSSQIYYDKSNKEYSLTPYTLVDLRLAKRLFDRMEIYLVGKNIFDVNYYESEGYPREGRMVFVGLRFDVMQ